MTRDEWLRIKQIVAQAWEQPEPARAEFLAAECGPDSALREQVERLLGATAEAAARELYETPVAVSGALAAIDAATRQTAVGLGSRVGAYRIVRELGRGGMGAVYLAERADGEFDLQVAIKFVGSRIQSESLVDRFREERRILALLDHPNIARLVDGGTTADGLPYVVMEYVDGVPIDGFCDRRMPTTRERVTLFSAVAAAVQYAHQRLVIHRDIKATNILVTAAGVPKLLDFGIATLVEPGQAAARATTVMRAVTPECASPEQLRGEPITVAADIYALGVLLYRLLAGQSPYGVAPLSDADLLRKICDEMPIAPSEIVRRADPAAVRVRIERDLDLIVLKALRKEPDRRYQSVEQLADDLARYLDRRPVLAAADSRRYRMQKFVRRHVVGVAATAAVILAVVGGAGVAIYQARVASQARAQAERRFEDVRRLADNFLFEVHDAIADLPGSLPARRLVVKRASEYLDSLAREAQNNVALQRDVAAAYQRLGTILGGGGVSSLGDLPGALRSYQSAATIRESLAARPDATADDIAELARLKIEQSRLSSTTGDLEGAERSATAAVTLLRSSHASWPDDTNEAQLATAWHQLGYIQAARGNRVDSLTSLAEAMTHARARVERHPGNAADIARLVRIAPDFAYQLGLARRETEALSILREARSRLEVLLAAEPHNTRYRQNLSLLLNHESVWLRSTGDQAAGLATLARSTAIAETLRAEDLRDQGALVTAMFTHLAYAWALGRAAQPTAALPQFREGIADADAILKVSPANTFAARERAWAKIALGQLMLEASRGAEGCSAIRDALTETAALAASPESATVDDPQGWLNRLKRQCGVGPGD